LTIAKLNGHLFFTLCHLLFWIYIRELMCSGLVLRFWTSIVHQLPTTATGSARGQERQQNPHIQMRTYHFSHAEVTLPLVLASHVIPRNDFKMPVLCHIFCMVDQFVSMAQFREWDFSPFAIRASSNRSVTYVSGDSGKLLSS